MKVWPTPTGLGLKLKCGTGANVTVGVAPAGSGPAIGTSGAALTGTLIIANMEVVIRAIMIVATSFLVALGLIFIFLFFSFSFYKPKAHAVGL